MAATHDTIAAIASPPGPGGLGIVRLSGANVRTVLARILTTAAEDWHPRQARRYDVVWPIDGGRLGLPCHLHLWPTQRSFTGEPAAEIHLIGSPPLLNEVLETVLTSGARPAHPGEFTLRAFLSGRIDLVQAEAVLAVIDAASDQELATALSQLAGGISSRLAEFRERMLLHLADLEAGLDFVEEDIDFVDRGELLVRLDEAESLIRSLLATAASRMQSSGRQRVVLAGLPNAGKSTLFNRLVGREQALVSDVPGTTRDYLAATIAAGGATFELIDTAGWESPRDDIEQAAATLRDEQTRQAHVVVWCTANDLKETDRGVDHRLSAQLGESIPNLLKIVTKCDGGSDSDGTSSSGELPVSARTGVGLRELLNRIATALSTGADRSEMIGATAARCGESLRHAAESLTRARELAAAGVGDELIALELRDVLDQLGRIAGQVDADDILDRIFSRFCIGK